MQEWQRERKEKLADLTLGAHIIAYLIVLVIIICSEPIKINHIYDLYNSTLKLCSILFPAAAFILLDDYLLHRKEQGSMITWNVAKHLALFLLITLVFFRYERNLTASGLYLLPVVLSSLTLGRSWGMHFATASTACLVALTGIFLQPP